MSQPRVALYTFGVFRLPSDDRANRGFHARNDLNFEAVEASEGFVARSGYADEPGPASWGAEVYPRFYEERGDGYSPATLSLWVDLESPMAFSYAGIHADALRHGRDWFVKPEWPPYAVWWVDGDHVPDWTEAVERHDHLHRHGPTAHAFDFKNTFDAGGSPLRIDHARMKELVRTNVTRQAANWQMARYL